MESSNPKHLDRKPSLLLSVAIFTVAVGLMAYLRLHVFTDRTISLTYGLPLLLCLWHRDRTLLWSMVAVFVGMASFKAFVVLNDFSLPDSEGLLQWGMHVMNTVIIGFAVHMILNLTDNLRSKNAELEQINEELAAREEEIRQQNDTLQTQSEELAQQNEEIQQQSEEVQQQSEELQAQTEELQAANVEMHQRECMLQRLLASLRERSGQRPVLERLCESLIQLVGEKATAAAVVEKRGEMLVVRAQSGISGLHQEQWPLEQSFARVVMEHSRTAFVDDLQERLDLIVTRPKEGLPFRSVLATPFSLGGEPVGALELYSETPQQWTTEQFRLIEWVAVQCSIILEALRLQEELSRSNAHLEQLVQERTAKLREMVDELEHFSYSITHDMRAPLRAMQGFAGLLEQECGEALDDQRKDYLRRITTAAARMDRLITDALSYSRTVRQEMALETVDARLLLKGIIESYPVFQPPNAQIEIPEEIPPVIANEAGLTQCFSNLLGNAVKFVADGESPRVRIYAQQRDDRVRLCFEDSGIGIPVEAQARIFGMFQRASKSYEGTGIGLALVRKVAERMSGKVGVESEPGKGSRFWIDLKRADGKDAQV